MTLSAGDRMDRCRGGEMYDRSTQSREDFQNQERGGGMLVLSRKPGEKTLIGDDVTVTIVRIGPNTVRIGIEAPRTMNIVREELCEPAGHCERPLEVPQENESL